MQRTRNIDKWVCIVDAYSTGSALAEAFSAAGWKLIHLPSAPTIPKALANSFHPEFFDVDIAFDSDLSAQLVLLHKYSPTVVVAGTESGTVMADQVAAGLGVSGNDPATSHLRRNKFDMARALGRAGLAAARQAAVSDPGSAVMAARSFRSWPVVVKPLDSAGCDGVQVCHGASEVASAFRAIHRRRNFIGSVNDRVLVQEFLTGPQYMINAVSISGQHHITEIWREERLIVRDVGVLYDKEYLLPYHGQPQGSLIRYIQRVLDALGVREGASHSELVLTDRGPVLIETAARLQGGIESAAMCAAIGDSHLTSLLRCYLDPQGFRASVGRPYRIKQIAMVVNLISDRAGLVKENNSRQLLQSLPSFYMISRTPPVGAQVQKTVNLLTKTGHIYLLHESLDQLVDDYKQIRMWERQGRLIILDRPIHPDHGLAGAAPALARETINEMETSCT